MQISLSLSLKGRLLSLFIIFIQHQRSMGNESSKLMTCGDNDLLDQLCSLTRQDYQLPYRLSRNPFAQELSQDSSPISHDFNISSIVDEAEETQPLQGACEPNCRPLPLSTSPAKAQSKGRCLQKNQILPKQTKKVKRIYKAQKLKTRPIMPLNPQEGQFNSNETAVDEVIRDQNNCKSYHKLLKNYLIEKGLGEQIEKYEPKYHTRYYFIVSLLMVKYLLKEDLTSAYEGIARAELAVQQKKIDRKLNELKNTREKMESHKSKGQEVGNLKLKEASLENQIEHIKVVKFEIENYSIRSCRSFFQGEIEESLKILYLKNDPVMRKKYYFEQALEVVKNIQLEMRKGSSHR